MRYRATERGWSASLPHNHPADCRRWEVASQLASTSGLAFRLSAVPATCGVHRTELRCAPHPERAFDFLSHIWLPAILHHPCPPPQPLAPLRYGRGSEHFSSRTRCAPTKSARDKGLPRRPRALLSLLTPDDGDKKLAEQAGGPVTRERGQSWHHGPRPAQRTRPRRGASWRHHCTPRSPTK